jgi:hypothetical protein
MQDSGSPPPSDFALRATERLAGLRAKLLEWRNADGGWGYNRGKRSRLEPTCWSLLALGQRDSKAARVIESWPRQDGWFVDVPGTPTNYAFNAVAAVTLRHLAPGSARAAALVQQIADVKGKTFAASNVVRQNNRIEAWPWVADTASWIEPTAWALLLLKAARQEGGNARLDARITAGEALLFDRVCHDGGWNYGNSNVFEKNLWPYVPTTALGLLALQDRREQSIVTRSLAQMTSDLETERSPYALAIALLALRVCDADADPTRAVARRLEADVASGLASVMSIAMALTALAPEGAKAFTL